MAVHTVVFTPQQKSVSVETGASLLEAAGKADIVISNVCGGDGICGRCKMIVKEGRVREDATMLLTREEIQKGYVLACQSFVESDAWIEIPAETLAGERVEVDQDAQRFRALHPGITRRPFSRAPLVSKVFLQLAEPTLENNTADCQRVEEALARATGIASMQMGLRVMRQVPQVLRDHNFAVTALVGRREDVAEIIDIEGGDTSDHNYIIAVDVGTSTVVAHLIKVNEMSTVDAEACFNSQAVYGREVTARIMATEKRGTQALQDLVVGDINRLITNLAARNEVAPRDITAVVCAGNAAMVHFLLGMPSRNMRRKPYIAADVEPPPLRAAEIGLRINPRGLLYCVPGISSWVGGDITAGILATGLYEREEIAMLIDVGTNGEIVLGNKDWMMACSASTGPALEGASVECGMIGEKGAIEKIFIQDGEIHFRVIGNVPPKGICGSGIVDMLAVLLDKGIIDRAGQFVAGSDRRLEFKDERGRFTLVSKEQGAVRDIRITQDDIDNIITAKAAVFAATKILLERLNLTFSDVSRLYLAGGFGNYLDRQNAVKIGLLPDLPLSRLQYVGNTAIWGAKLAALSVEAQQALRQIRKGTTYYDLLGSTDYVEQFKQAMFLPHTDIQLFPSVSAAKGAIWQN
jgi:uncharacterized 2Fe-2S/4Fe-4S cluster protein (DUF4445 family)